MTWSEKLNPPLDPTQSGRVTWRLLMREYLPLFPLHCTYPPDACTSWIVQEPLAVFTLSPPMIIGLTLANVKSPLTVAPQLQQGSMMNCEVLSKVAVWTPKKFVVQLVKVIEVAVLEVMESRPYLLRYLPIR